MSENLSVFTFGGLRILKNGESLAGVDSRKVEALFIYLALSQRPQPREILADLLWDDRTQQQAQANLRRVLSGLRKHFGPYAEITRTTAALNWENDLWLDARELQSGIEPLESGFANLSLKIASQVDDALRLYHGDFLAGFHVRGSRNFDAWLSEQREHWRQVVLDCAGTLISFYESVQSFKEGIALARWALQIDPLQETNHRRLMRLLAQSGQRTDALQQYEHCSKLLEDELGVPLESETKALFEAIASGALSVTQPSPTITPVVQAEEQEPLSELDEQLVPINLSSDDKPHLEITALGGLSIYQNGKPVPALHSRKAQALLVYLALTARPQPREVLADLLWEDFSQQKAMNNLRVVFSSLRKQLGDQLLITRDTAGMNPEMEYDLDMAVLDASLGFAGEYERKTGRLDREAVVRIEQAVELYKGEFLAGFFVEKAPEFEAWMVVERERLHHIVLDGLGKLVRWELEQGEYTAGIRHASRWVQLDPLSETAHRQMMRLLAYSGQRSAALAQYDKCREIFAEELGVEPDSRTTALYEQIREGAFALDETIPQPISTSKPGKRDLRRHNLPLQTTPFIGREQELAELDQLLRDSDVRLVTVMGAGGMGKTRLALQVGEGLLDQFPDGVFLVSLARLQSVDLILPSIIQTLGIEIARGSAGNGDSQTDLKESLLRNLRRKQMLLILDNFEHLLDGVGLVGEIIQAAPGVKALVTSRVRLNVDGEHGFQVGGMAYPEDIMDKDAQNFSAVRLFLESAHRAWSGFRLRPDEMQHIAKICRLVDGMPLGVRLAATWVGTLSLEEIATEITQDLDVLETDLRDVPDRHRSIRALFDQSWNLLSERERNVFAGFSVFRGGCSREAAAHVTGATLRDLRNFGDKSLLNRTLTRRYELHELSREYAAGKLDENPESKESVHSRHSTYYCSAVREWGDDLKSTRQEIALAEMDLEIENARVAWSWAVESHKSDLLNQSIEGLWRYFDIRMRWQEGERIFHHAAESLNSATSGDELRVYARMLSLQGNFSHGDERKRELYQQSMEVVNQLELSGQELPNEKAWVSYLMGELASKSDFEESVRLYKQSLHLFEKLGNCYWISETLYGLGVTYYLWGKLDDSLNYQQQSLVNFRKLGDPRKIAHILGQFTYIYLRQGEFEKAERAARERLEIYEMIGDPSAIAFGQGELGGCYRHLGKFEAAKTLLENAVKVFKELEHISAFFSNTAMLGFVQLDLGDYAQANDLAQAALAWSGGRVFPLPGWPNFRDTEMRRMGITFTIQGMASFAMGNLSDAEHYLQRSFDVLSEIQPITQTTYHHPILGIVSLNLNKPDQAKEHIWDGLNIGMQINSAMVHLNTLGAAALYLAEKGDLERAVEIYALASRYPEIAKSQWQKDVVEGPLTKLVASLPPDVVAQAQQRGRERDLVETVQELLVELA